MTDQQLTQCSTCRAFGPDVKRVGVRSDSKVPVHLCRTCREAQGFEPRAEVPRPSVVKGEHPGEIRTGCS